MESTTLYTDGNTTAEYNSTTTKTTTSTELKTTTPSTTTTTTTVQFTTESSDVSTSNTVGGNGGGLSAAAVAGIVVVLLLIVAAAVTIVIVLLVRRWMQANKSRNPSSHGNNQNIEATTSPERKRKKSNTATPKQRKKSTNNPPPGNKTLRMAADAAAKLKAKFSRKQSIVSLSDSYKVEMANPVMERSSVTLDRVGQSSDSINNQEGPVQFDIQHHSDSDEDIENLGKTYHNQPRPSIDELPDLSHLGPPGASFKNQLHTVPEQEQEAYMNISEVKPNIGQEVPEEYDPDSLYPGHGYNRDKRRSTHWQFEDISHIKPGQKISPVEDDEIYLNSPTITTKSYIQNNSRKMEHHDFDEDDEKQEVYVNSPKITQKQYIQNNSRKMERHDFEMDSPAGSLKRNIPDHGNKMWPEDNYECDQEVYANTPPIQPKRDNNKSNKSLLHKQSLPVQQNEQHQDHKSLDHLAVEYPSGYQQIRKPSGPYINLPEQSLTAVEFKDNIHDNDNEEEEEDDYQQALQVEYENNVEVLHNMNTNMSNNLKTKYRDELGLKLNDIDSPVFIRTDSTRGRESDEFMKRNS